MKLIGVLTMVGLLLTGPVLAAPIENVQVTVVDTRGGTSAPLLHKMEGSMQAVAQQLFQDKDSAKVQLEGAAYAKLLAEVSDRVLTGYQTDAVAIVPGSVTLVTFRVTPWSDVVQNAVVDLQFSGVTPLMDTYLQSKLPGIKEKLAGLLNGISLDATDWAGGVLRNLVQGELEKSLPEFKAAVDLRSSEGKTVLQVIIYPSGEVVHRVRYEMISRSIPNLLFMDMKYRYQEKTSALRGLPVTFVTRDQKNLETLLTGQLKNENQVRVHNLTPTVEIIPGSDTTVNIRIESSEYKIWFEGYGDVGRHDENLSGRAHIGRFLSRRDEIFGEAGVDLKDVAWNFSGGYALHSGKSTWSYMRRDPSAENVYRIEYDFTPKWRFRYEHFSADHVNEYALRYRIHEFLSAEYVYSTEKSYFRIVGNL